MWTQKIRIKRASEKDLKNHNDLLAMEKTVSLTVNGALQAKICTIPKQEKDLATGYLIASGQIYSASDMTSLTVQGTTIDITTSPKTDARLPVTPLKAKLHPHHIFHLSAYFQENALLFKDTAITESAALANTDKIHFFAEDLSVENAIHKVIGSAANQEAELPPILIVSGKITVAMVDTATKLGITTILSRTAPTYEAVNMAKTSGLMLVGFCRGRRCNIYTSPDTK